MTRIGYQPSGFLTAEWRAIAMLNYEIAPSMLARFVPTGTELDSWNGRTFVSLVGFRFLRTRVLGIAVPFHRDFEEVNLRFYVRRRSADGWRRGVVFIKEIVPRPALALVARAVYRENYIWLPMRHHVELPSSRSRSGGSAAYGWRHRRRWNWLRVRVSGGPSVPHEESEESFITEHYWGYAGRPGRATVEYQVEHPRWRLWQAEEAELDGDLEALYGSELAHVLRETPSSAFLAEGSAVRVRRGLRL